MYLEINSLTKLLYSSSSRLLYLLSQDLDFYEIAMHQGRAKRNLTWNANDMHCDQARAVQQQFSETVNVQVHIASY